MAIRIDLNRPVEQSVSFQIEKSGGASTRIETEKLLGAQFRELTTEKLLGAQIRELTTAVRPALSGAPHLASLAKPRLAWTPRRPHVPDQRYALDDDGCSVLGNALLAAWFNRLQQSNRCPSEGLRAEVSERTELRDLLEREGMLHDAFAGPYRLSGDYQPESMSECEDRLEAALNSSEAFARLSVGMIDFGPSAALPSGLPSALAALTPFERRQPIARLGPCHITRELRQLVHVYLRGQMPETAEDAERQAKAAGGPRTRSERARQKLVEKRLRELAAQNPQKRATMRAWLDAAQDGGFSGRAAKEIWRAAAPDAWRLSGRPARDSSLFSTSELSGILAPK